MAASSEQEGQSLFAVEASAEAGGPLDDAEVAGRELRLRTRQRVRLALGVVLASAAVVGVAVAWRRSSTVQLWAAGEDLEAAQMKVAGIPPFKKCGGTGYTGNGCCKPGCACIIQSRFFSQCAAPGGGKTCSVTKAKNEVDAAKEQAVQARPDALEAIREYKQRAKAAGKAREELEEAEAVLNHATSDGAKVRHKRDHTESLVDHAKDLAKAAAKAADDKLDHYESVKKEIQDINKTASLRSHGKCGALFAECGPISPPKLTAWQACCVPGCICKWRDSFYAQCQSPDGQGGCNPARETAHIAEREATMAKLLEEHKQLEARRIKTKEHAEKMDKDAEDIRHKAAVAGTKRVKAHGEMMRRKAHAQQLAQKAHEARARAQHAKHAVHYASKAIKAWEEAAEGKACEGHDDDSEEEEQETEEDADDDEGDGGKESHSDLITAV